MREESEACLNLCTLQLDQKRKTPKISISMEKHQIIKSYKTSVARVYCLIKLTETSIRQRRNNDNSGKAAQQD